MIDKRGQQIPAEGLRLCPGKRRTLFLLAPSLALTAVGARMAAAGEGVIAWLCASFFGLCSIVFAIQLSSRATYLDLLPDGFVACTLFRRWPLVRWDRVSEFRVVPVPPSGVRMVVYDSDSPRRGRLAAVNRRFAGASDALPDTYGRKADELADLMNTWRRRALMGKQA